MPDRMRYALHKFDFRLSSAHAVITKALGQVPHWALSCSFGKDSIVLLDILIEMGHDDMPILYSDRGPEAELPETETVIEQMQERHSFQLVRVVPRLTMFQLYRALGGIPGITAPGNSSLIRRNNLEEPIDGWIKEHNIMGSFLGRRIEENPRTRGKHLSVRGPLHFNVGRDLWVCDPLYNWTGADIWAYIVQNDLPYHPLYDLMARENEGRERARLSNWSGIVGIKYGRWAWLKQHYPDLFNRFAAEFPEVRCYV